jgi:metal-responsive CopG/Arc/MetJ family transcriptional regulator
MKQKVTIKIPKELYEKLKKTIEGTGFSSVTEFIVFVMRTIVMGGKIREKHKFKKKDIEEVKKRLRRLGYIK